MFSNLDRSLELGLGEVNTFGDRSRHQGRLIGSAFIRNEPEHEEGNESEGTMFNYICRFEPLDAMSFYRPF